MGLEKERKLVCNLIRSENALLTLFVVLATTSWFYRHA